MSIVRSTAPQRLVLYGEPWETYSRLLRLFPGRRLRITYDRGTLEIMTLTHRHETINRFLAYLVCILTEELGLPLKQGGSNTMKRRRLLRGLEPDSCFWIGNEPRVRGKTRLDWRVDPPPDLALEIDISHSSLNRQRIYEALRVPELWRLGKKGLTFFCLDANGRYACATSSQVFPGLKPDDLVQFLVLQGQMDENAIVRQFRTWIRQHLAPSGSSRPTP